MSVIKVTQIAPLGKAAPPRLCGGTERVFSYLSEELVRQGHQGDGQRSDSHRAVQGAARGRGVPAAPKIDTSSRESFGGRFETRAEEYRQSCSASRAGTIGRETAHPSPALGRRVERPQRPKGPHGMDDDRETLHPRRSRYAPRLLGGSARHQAHAIA